MATESPHNPFKETFLGLFIGTTAVSCVAIFKVFVTQRKRNSLVPYLEDCLLILAVIFTYVTLALTYIATARYGLGLHIVDVSYDSIIKLCTLLFINGLLDILIHGFVRISLLISVRRLYSPLRNSRDLQRVCDGLMTIELLAVIACILWAFLSTPFDPKGTTALEVTQAPGAPVNSTVGIFTLGLILDVPIMLSPVPLVFKLKNLSRKRVIQILVVIACGFATLLASVARLTELIILQNDLNNDATYFLPRVVIISGIESILSKLTICLPTAMFVLRWAYADHQLPIHETPSHMQSTQPLEMTVSQLTAKTDDSLIRSPPIVHSSPHPPPPSRQSRRPNSMIVEEKDSGPVVVQATRNHADDSDVVVEVDEDAEEDDSNFFEMLVPSDKFFPLATQLSPRRS